MKLTNLPGGLKMSHGPSGQPRLNAVSMAPRVRVGKNLKLWLGNQPQNWSLTYELSSGDGHLIQSEKNQQGIHDDKPTKSFELTSNSFVLHIAMRHGPLEWMWEYSTFMLVYYALQNIHHFSILLLLRPSTQCTTDLPRSRRSPNWQNSLFSTPTALQGASRTL